MQPAKTLTISSMLIAIFLWTSTVQAHYSPELGRWLERDPLMTGSTISHSGERAATPSMPGQYLVGMDLYEYAGGRAVIQTDPEGLRPITTLFGAFISGRLGVWIREPVFGSPWFFKTNNRGFGGGSYKVYGYGRVESTELGRIDRSNSDAWIGTGASVRRRPAPGGGWVYETAQATPEGVAASKNTGPCSTRLVLAGKATYPFWPANTGLGRAWITIDFRWVVEFTVVREGEVGVSYWGWHDAFPEYEGFIDKTLLYKYSTPFPGPTPWNLGPGSNVTIPGFGVIVSAETPDWCCKKGG